MLTEFKHRNLF